MSLRRALVSRIQRLTSDTDRAAERLAREARRAERTAQIRAFATHALSWPLNAWLEGGLWACMALALLDAYAVSYNSIAVVAAAFGYGAWERWGAPLSIDLPTTASVLGQFLAGRWDCGRWVRIRLGLLTLVWAPLTLVGNALNGAIDPATGGFLSTFPMPFGAYLVAFAVPGACVIAVAYIGSMMLGERARLTKRAIGRSAAERAPERPSAVAPAHVVAPDKPVAERPSATDAEQLEQAIAYVRDCQASRKRATGKGAGQALGLSEARGRVWLGRAMETLGERSTFRPAPGGTGQDGVAA